MIRGSYCAFVKELKKKNLFYQSSKEEVGKGDFVTETVSLACFCFYIRMHFVLLAEAEAQPFLFTVHTIAFG